MDSDSPWTLHSTIRRILVSCCKNNGRQVEPCLAKRRPLVTLGLQPRSAGWHPRTHDARLENTRFLYRITLVQRSICRAILQLPIKYCLHLAGGWRVLFQSLQQWRITKNIICQKVCNYHNYRNYALPAYSVKSCAILPSTLRCAPVKGRLRSCIRRRLFSCFRAPSIMDGNCSVAGYF